MAPTADLTIQSGAVLAADSSVESGNLISGTGTLYLAGNGDVSGPISSQAVVTGTYAVAGQATFGFNLDIAGDLALNGADTLTVAGQLATINGTGRLIMTDANALADVDGPVNFAGGSTSGLLTAGLLRITHDFITGGPNNDAFAPSAGHTTMLSGSADQLVTFAVADTGTTGSHFGTLQVSTTGLAIMRSPTWVTGNLLLTVGATQQIEDPAGGSFAAAETAQDIFDSRTALDAPAADNVFAALSSLRAALLSDDVAAIGQAGVSIQAATAKLNSAQAFYGTVQGRIRDATSYADRYEIDLRTQLSQKEDADVVSAAMEMSQANTQLQAAFQMRSLMPHKSLFEFIG
jgi:flagellin-like hook-associated protein FlgL